MIKSHIFKGRILTIDLCFKGNNYIRIISCYLPADTSKDKDLIISCYQHIELRLIEAHDKKYQIIIILGDFNINFDKIKNYKPDNNNQQNKSYPKWRKEINNIIEGFSLIDEIFSSRNHVTRILYFKNRLHIHNRYTVCSLQIIKQSVYTIHRTFSDETKIRIKNISGLDRTIIKKKTISQNDQGKIGPITNKLIELLF